MTGTVHVCWSSLSPPESGMGWLDATERARFDRLTRVEARRGFVTSRMLVKTLVGRLAGTPAALVRLTYDCPRCGKSHGRPVVVEPPAAVGWHVSLSRSVRHVLVAATDAGPVGVDVERIAATEFGGFDKVALTPGEQAEVERYAPAARARARAVYWTRKEAVLKATGRGLAVDPTALEVSAPHLPAALMGWHADEPPTAPAQLTDVFVGDDGEDQVAAVAVLAHAPCEVAIQQPPAPIRLVAEPVGVPRAATA